MIATEMLLLLALAGQTGGAEPHPLQPARMLYNATHPLDHHTPTEWAGRRQVLMAAAPGRMRGGCASGGCSSNAVGGGSCSSGGCASGGCATYAIGGGGGPAAGCQSCPPQVRPGAMSPLAPQGVAPLIPQGIQALPLAPVAPAPNASPIPDNLAQIRGELAELRRLIAERPTDGLAERLDAIHAQLAAAPRPESLEPLLRQFAELRLQLDAQSPAGGLAELRAGVHALAEGMDTQTTHRREELRLLEGLVKVGGGAAIAATPLAPLAPLLWGGGGAAAAAALLALGAAVRRRRESHRPFAEAAEDAT